MSFVLRRGLTAVIERRQLQMNAAAADERYGEAQELQSQLNTAVAEAAGLEEMWGFDREGEDRVQQQAGPSMGPSQGLQPGLGLQPSEDASKSVGASTCSRSSTVIIHPAIDGRDSEAFEAADPAADSASAATGAEPGLSALLRASDSGSAAPGEACHAGEQPLTADAPASDVSAWRSNDLFDGSDGGLQALEASMEQSAELRPLGEGSSGGQIAAGDDEHALPSRAPAEQLLQEARQAP